MSFDRDDAKFKVLVSDEAHYTIWPDYKQTPNGWREVGKVGTKQDCLAYVDTVWTETPLSS